MVGQGLAASAPGGCMLQYSYSPIAPIPAKKLGVDRLMIREINAPDGKTRFAGQQQQVSSAYMRDALAMGAEAFDWETKKNRSGERNGSSRSPDESNQ